MAAAKINIKVSVQQILEAVKQLTPAQKLKLNEVLWESGMPIPKEHQDLVLARMERARQYPETMLDWDGVSKTLVP